VDRRELAAVRPSGRVVVGISTIPSRIEHIGATIASLRSQSRVPDVIYLSLPRYSVREERPYVLPDFLRDAPGVEVIWTDADYGPGTKLLGCLERVLDDDIVVLLDDDLRYKRFVLEYLAGAIRNASEAASFFVYESRGLRVGQGADGFAMMGLAARQCSAVREDLFRYPSLRYHDDYWVSFLLRGAGVRVTDLGPLLATLGEERSYEFAHEINPLFALDGSLRRSNLNREASRLLFREHSPTVAMRVQRLWGYPRAAMRRLNRLRWPAASRTVAG
jgi:hypothetical protein